MRILVDGDSSGHRDYMVGLCKVTGAELVWVCNFANKPPVQQDGLRLTVILTDIQDQSADMQLMNLAGPEDIVVTGDLGLASVCMAKGAAALSPRGFWFRHDKLEQSLEWRALAARLKRGGVHLDKKSAARRLDDHRFEEELRHAVLDPRPPKAQER